MYLDEKEKNEEKKRLYRLLCEREKEFESAKLKRMIITIIGFAIFYFYVFYGLEKPTGIAILFCVLLSIVFATAHFFINATIFGALAQKGRAESDILENIRKEISNLK